MKAGIRVIMITGDATQTAINIAQRCGMFDKEVYTTGNTYIYDDNNNGSYCRHHHNNKNSRKNDNDNDNDNNNINNHLKL